MTKGRPITRLTPATCEEIQTRMLEVCQKIAEDNGLVIEGAGWRGTDTGFFFEPVFRVSIPASDGTAFNLEKDRFEFLAEHFGLAPSDFGREFRTGRERIPDRRGFKFAAENVAMLLQAKENKPRRSRIVPQVGQNRSFGPIRPSRTATNQP